MRIASLLFALLVVAACTDHPKSVTPRTRTEIFDSYTPLKSQSIYSEAVSDSFKIFTTTPLQAETDTSAKYPLILLLDANAYFESVAAEVKLAELTQGLPKCVIAGIGYDGFWAMDSLRNRDYTYPVAPVADSFKISGGGLLFKKFIDTELLPHLSSTYTINKDKIVLIGHSLGGYFVLYYMMDAIGKNNSPITNFVAASPSIWYGDNYLIKKVIKPVAGSEMQKLKVFTSVGSLEMDSTQKDNDLDKLMAKLEVSHAIVRKDVLGGFDHMNAAIPGFIKGLIFIFVE